MKNRIFNIYLCLLVSIFFTTTVLGQNTLAKKTISESEKNFIQKTFDAIIISDQLYRNKLSKGTLDERIIAEIDSVFDTEGIRAGVVYEENLNLSLSKSVEDSLWQLQAALDFQNHLTLRGLWAVYGFIPKEVVKENQFVQILLLAHPPKDWDVRTYLKKYSDILIEEVKANRMPAITYATFYDNMKAKILKEPQLYGTNQQFDMKTKSLLPPKIKNLEESNLARQAIGLPALEKGQYRIFLEEYK